MQQFQKSSSLSGPVVTWWQEKKSTLPEFGIIAHWSRKSQPCWVESMELPQDKENGWNLGQELSLPTIHFQLVQACFLLLPCWASTQSLSRQIILCTSCQGEPAIPLSVKRVSFNFCPLYRRRAHADGGLGCNRWALRRGNIQGIKDKLISCLLNFFHVPFKRLSNWTHHQFQQAESKILD